MPRKMLYEKIYSERVEVEQNWDGSMMSEKTWSTAMDRDAWRLLVQEAKAHKGL
jgi:hypothetical protein